MRSFPWRVTLIGLLILPPAAVAQVGQADAVPRLPWGVPDLQGIWLRQSSTPLERDAAVADKAVLTPAEAAGYLAERHAAINRYLALDLNADWPSLGGLTDRRTSLIVSPSNGRLPARTPVGRRRSETLGRSLLARGADGPEDREYFERCILGRSVPFVAPSWDERLQIVQAPDHVALADETGELRLVPLMPLPPLPESIRQWAGSPRGRWEGDTLVMGDPTLQWEVDVPRGRAEHASRRTVHEDLGPAARVRVHGSRPRVLRRAVDRGLPVHAGSGSDLRSGVPRGQLQHAADAGRWPRSGAGRAEQVAVRVQKAIVGTGSLDPPARGHGSPISGPEA